MVQNDPFALKNFFFRKTIDTNFMYLLALFIVQNFFKKCLEWIQGYENMLFLGPKCPNCLI